MSLPSKSPSREYPKLARVQRTQSGFTLIELIIAFALLGLMILLLYSAFDVAAKSWDRVEARAEETADLRLAQSFLRREIGHAFALRIGKPGENKIAFDGDAQHLRFAAALPGGVAAGGLSMVGMELVDDRIADRTPESASAAGADFKALIVKHTLPESDARDFSALDNAEKSVLLHGVEKAELAYFGQDNDQQAPSWRDHWEPGPRIPSLVRISIKLARDTEAREMLVATRLGEEAGCFQSSFQRQCGGRK